MSQTPHPSSSGAGTGAEESHASLRRTIMQIRAIQNGEKAAAESLFARYADVVRRIVRHRLGRDRTQMAEFEDLTQEALMAAFRNIGTFRPTSEANFRSWLARIVQDKIIDALRRAGAQQRGGGRVVRTSELSEREQAKAEPPGREPTPSQTGAARELEDAREAALLGLSEYHREVLTLRDQCGMTFQEIADELDLGGQDAARMTYRRANQKLREALRGHAH